MCTPGTFTRIFIDGRTLHIKRLVGNSNSVRTYRSSTITKKTYRTNVPYPYQRTLLLCKKLRRTVLPSLANTYVAEAGGGDGVDNKKCIRMLRCIRKPCPHAAPHRIQTQLSSCCIAPQVIYPLNFH